MTASMANLPKLYVVVGVGDGSVLRGLDPAHTAVLTLPGEEAPNGYASWPAEDLAGAVSVLFSQHLRIVQLANAVFLDAHPVDNKKYRKPFLKRLYGELCRLPLMLGDTCMDGLQGIQHMAQNWETLRHAPYPEDWMVCKVPAIAIGAGPSLKDHIDQVRELQHKCILVCGVSTLDGLLDEGITPHVVSIHERLPLMSDILKRDSYPDVVFGGLPVVVPDVVQRFGGHLMVGNTDLPYLWMGIPNNRVHYVGRSAGTQTVSLAKQITKGKVYLVGHDLCFGENDSHWGQSTSIRNSDKDSFVVPGYNGDVKTHYWWDVFRGDIAAVARESGDEHRFVNCCHHGALIEGIQLGELPDPGELPDKKVRMPKRAYSPVGPAGKFSVLVEDCESALDKLDSAEDLAADKLFSRRTACIFAYVLRSVYGSASMDRRQMASFTTDTLRESLRNALSGMMGILRESTCAAITTPA